MIKTLIMSSATIRFQHVVCRQLPNLSLKGRDLPTQRTHLLSISFEVLLLETKEGLQCIPLGFSGNGEIMSSLAPLTLVRSFLILRSRRSSLSSF